jgi:hypothetical protein
VTYRGSYLWRLRQAVGHDLVLMPGAMVALERDDGRILLTKRRTNGYRVEATGVRRYWLIWAAVIPIALWAVVRSFGLENGGQLTSLMWFTPYAAIAALLVAGIALALRNWAAAAVAAGRSPR